MTDADTLVRRLGMAPHPEGGWYVETWRAPAPEGRRPDASAILFLLREGERSHWHRVDAAEVWLHHTGDALDLGIVEDGAVAYHRVGSDVGGGEEPQVIVPAGAWQAARSLGAWSLVSCIVAPAFEFEGFELAPPGWSPEG